MSMYYALVAGLRELSFDGIVDAPAVRREIREGVSRRDREYVDLLLSRDYDACSRSGSRFLREWSVFDSGVRRTVAAIVARRLGVPYDMHPTDERVRGILSAGNILERERGLDRLRWEVAGELSVFDYFNIDAVLAYLVRVQILERWLALNAERGKEVLNKLVYENDGEGIGDSI